MPIQDTSEIKEKMLFVLRQRGPSLPVHIARGTGLSILFASAFLSELLSERKIKISHMKVGSSPIYYIPGQEAQIENFAHHLGNKEKEAFTLLQNKKILEDSEQLPAIRVALRSIKDFAIPFKKEDKILWRYYLIPEKESETKPQAQKTKTSKESKTLDIFEKPKSPEVKKSKLIMKKTSKNNDKFFNKVKTFLTSKSIEILDIESFNKNELIVRAKINDVEEILIAYNKKRINEEDIIKAHKKVSDRNCKYRILCLGEPLKKTKSIIKAVKDLKGIEKIEDN